MLENCVTVYSELAVLHSMPSGRGFPCAVHSNTTELLTDAYVGGLEDMIVTGAVYEHIVNIGKEHVEKCTLQSAAHTCSSVCHTGVYTTDYILLLE